MKMISLTVSNNAEIANYKEGGTIHIVPPSLS